MDRLARRLGLGDAVVLGLGSMVGAGVFTAFSPAAEAAGSLLLVALAAAGAVAYCNASSSARLAARYPQSGGTYVYGRERLGPFWGYLAGWCFITGKLASCAAMALAVGSYLWPPAAKPLAVLAVLGITALNYRGVQRSALATRAMLAVVLLVLGVVAVVAWTGPAAPGPPADAPRGALGVLEGAAFLFFAFAGYARIATLGEEVRDPARTIPRAVTIALGLALAVYAVVGLGAARALGIPALADSLTPLADAVSQAGSPGLVPLVQVGGVAASLGSLLALVLGVSRTTLAMARDGHLPRALDAVHPAYRVPHRAELAVGVAAVGLVLALDLRGAIGFSSFCVLLYYAIANASAWTLGGGLARRAVPVLGLLGCLALAAALPPASVLRGALVVSAGVGLWVARGRWRRGRRRQ